MDARPNESRPLANYQPSLWGDYYLNYVPYNEVTRAKMEKEAKELEDEVKRELRQLQAKVDKRLELVRFIDVIERLGVSYRLEEEIEQAMKVVHDQKEHFDKDELFDLFHTSLSFRFLRQHGFHVSCDVFKKFQDEKGRFKESLGSDVKGLLSLYEASFVAKHGDYVLDEARAYSISHLKSVAAESIHPLASQVSHALFQSLNRGMTRLESRIFISFYQDDPSHDKILLKLAKLDFNIVQDSYKKELSDLTRWWKDLGLTTKMPFESRDRLVECYFWILGMTCEPQNALGRKMLLKMLKLITVVDDVYDSYGTFEELTIFTKAMERWNRTCMTELPEYMQLCYKVLLDTFEEFEGDLVPSGRSQFVRYARKEMISLVRAYLQDAKWRGENYNPTFDEYMEKASIVSTSCYLVTVSGFLNLKEANEEAFEWLDQNPLFVRDIAIMGRLMNDVAGHAFEQERVHVPSAVENYMRQYGVNEEAAQNELKNQVNRCWKDINEMMIKPHIMPKPLLILILNQCRMIDVVYKKGKDSYTFPNLMKNNISLVLTDPIPIM